MVESQCDTMLVSVLEIEVYILPSQPRRVCYRISPIGCEGPIALRIERVPSLSPQPGLLPFPITVSGQQCKGARLVQGRKACRVVTEGSLVKMSSYFATNGYPKRPLSPLSILAAACSKMRYELEREQYIEIKVQEWIDRRICSSNWSGGTVQAVKEPLLPNFCESFHQNSLQTSNYFPELRHCLRPEGQPVSQQASAGNCVPCYRLPSATTYSCDQSASAVPFPVNGEDCYSSMPLGAHSEEPHTVAERERAKSVDYNTAAIPHHTSLKTVGFVNRRPFVCPHPSCGKRYAKSGHLRSHLMTHSGERPFRCEWQHCGKSFVRRDELNRHVRVHTGERAFSCKVCGRCFQRSDHLKKHLRSLHGGLALLAEACAASSAISAATKCSTAATTITTTAATTATTLADDAKDVKPFAETTTAASLSGSSPRSSHVTSIATTTNSAPVASPISSITMSPTDMASPITSSVPFTLHFSPALSSPSAPLPPSVILYSSSPAVYSSVQYSPTPACYSPASLNYSTSSASSASYFMYPARFSPSPTSTVSSSTAPSPTPTPSPVSTTILPDN